MVRCIVQDRKMVEEDLLKILEQKAKAHFPYVEIFTQFNMDYPKGTHRKELVFNVSNTLPIKVADFIKIFDVTWDYSEGMVFDKILNMSLYEEDAVWSALCNPKELFLLSEVTWAHIYTWHE